MRDDRKLEELLDRYVEHFVIPPEEAIERPPFRDLLSASQLVNGINDLPAKPVLARATILSVRAQQIREATERGRPIQETK